MGTVKVVCSLDSMPVELANDPLLYNWLKSLVFLALANFQFTESKRSKL